MTILDDPIRYTVGWIAVLPIERAAATALLDDVHEAPKGYVQHQSDTNSYTWGRTGKHNIVIASLPAGLYGIASAAVTASNLLSSLPQIRIGLLVGIGGAIPRPGRDWDIRLGDIVVSQPDGTTGGVIQYDLGKAKLDQEWERKGSLNKPPPILLNALASLQAQHEIQPSTVPDILQAMWAAKPHMTKPRNKLSAFVYQGSENDRLFKTEYDHAGGNTCAKCDTSWEIKRDQRDTTDPEVHYGIIASGNTLVKDAATREKIAELSGEACICFEMEAAGLMDRFPCLVIRGICDYADSHKNDQWQRYASATAAAYAKELLGYVPVNQLQASQRAVDMLRSISEGINKIQTATTSVQDEVQGIHTMVRNFNQREVLTRLEDQVAAGAFFDSDAEQHKPRCLPNTRIELLQQISEWADNKNAEAILWLNGMAGTGKSTISQTVAESLARENRLGASFFFKRGELDRGTTAKMLSTIAADLTRIDPNIARYIKSAIEDNPTIFRKAIREQFDKLILQPLSMVQRREPVVLVVDALDECDGEEDIKLMIRLFSQASTLQSVQLENLLTSRPELPIRLGFKGIEGKYQGLILHDVPKLTLEHDISVFLETELARIRVDYNASVPDNRHLARDWPGQLYIRTLVKMAIPLFIFASTVTRFIADRKCGNPDQQLKEVLHFQQMPEGSQMDATYLPVLNKLINGLSKKHRGQVLQQFRDIVGSIVILGSPLATIALSQVLNIPRDVIDVRLDLLHSVLSIPSSAESPVRLLHLSFRDFLLDPEQRSTNPFWIDEKEAHRAMAANCLRVMGCLRQDICRLGAPGTRRSTVERHVIKAHLRPEIQYACLYWVYHIQGTGSYDGDCEQVYSFIERHFLHWIESLSLIGKAWESVRLIKALQLLYKLYSSALIFTPETSKVRTTFKGQLASWILLEPQVESNWSQTLQTLEGHSRTVSSVAFSPNSKLIASASWDRTVRLWRAETGEHVQTLEGHRRSVNSVAFSPDGMLIISASDDGTVRFWRADTGECLQTLKGCSSTVNSAVFSPNGMLIASAYCDRTIRVWHAETGECIQTLKGRSRIVRSVAFSPDGMLIVSATDHTVRLWRAETGDCMQVLEGHRDNVNSAVFSPNGMLLMSIHGQTV